MCAFFEVRDAPSRGLTARTDPHSSRPFIVREREVVLVRFGAVGTVEGEVVVPGDDEFERGWDEGEEVEGVCLFGGVEAGG